MQESFQVGLSVPERYRVGPLGPYVDRLAAELAARQEARLTSRHKLRVIAQLSQWLKRRHLDAASLDDRLIAKFLRAQMSYDTIRHGDWAAVRSLLKLLRDSGVVPPPRPKQDSVRHFTEIGFEQYMRQERRLSQASLANTLPFVHRFLAHRFGTGAVAVDQLQPADVTRFVLHHARTLSPSRAKLLAWALRAYLRFLYWRGEIATDLSSVVPRVATWRLSSVPKSIEPAEVERLLKSCDRGTIVGQRDHAILLLLARLGLRSGEVMELTLDDIDWQAGQLTVRGKGSRCDRLP
jgi:site-specific recombinase XerD